MPAIDIWRPSPGYVSPMFTVRLKPHTGRLMHYRAALYTQHSIGTYQELFKVEIAALVERDDRILLADPDGPVTMSVTAYEKMLRAERKAAKEEARRALTGTLLLKQHPLFTNPINSL